MALTQQYKQTIHAAKNRLLRAQRYALTDNDEKTANRLGEIIVLIDKEESIYNENQKIIKANPERMQRKSLQW